MTTIIMVTESDTTPVRFSGFIKTRHDKTFVTDLETSEPGWRGCVCDAGFAKLAVHI